MGIVLVLIVSLYVFIKLVHLILSFYSDKSFFISYLVGLLVTFLLILIPSSNSNKPMLVFVISFLTNFSLFMFDVLVLVIIGLPKNNFESVRKFISFLKD